MVTLVKLGEIAVEVIRKDIKAVSIVLCNFVP